MLQVSVTISTVDYSKCSRVDFLSVACTLELWLAGGPSRNEEWMKNSMKNALCY